MRYSSFFLESYKGIHNRLTLDIDMKAKVPHCIIGNNESGKTTILEGVELISKLCNGNSLENGDRKRIRPKGNYFTGTVKLGAVLSCPKDTIASHAELSKYLLESEGDISITLEFFYKFERTSYVQDTRLITLNSEPIPNEEHQIIFNVIKENAPEIIYYDDFKFAVPETIQFTVGSGDNASGDVGSDENKHWQKIFTDILKETDKNSRTFQEDVVDWHLDDNNDRIIANDRMRHMSEQLSLVLKDWITKNQRDIRSFEISEATEMQRQTADGKTIKGYQIKIISGRDTYKMNERSKGLQWSFCFHILTKFRKNRHDKGCIFLLDEPANNLHVDPQKRMLNHLNQLCSDDKCVVIYSTHSPQLIGITEEHYLQTYIAKNKSKEMMFPDIYLTLLSRVGEDELGINIQDIEPILCKLSYEDIKLLVKKGEGDDEKRTWKSLLEHDAWKNIGKASNLATLFNFIKGSFLS